MNPVKPGAADDTKMHVQKPFSGQVLRNGLTVLHGGKDDDPVHSLREARPDVQTNPRKRGFEPIEGMIFVFGSNLAGRHGGGAARTAFESRDFPYFFGEGLANSCYALPTKDADIETLPLEVVRMKIRRFIWFAEEIHSTEAGYAATPDVMTYGHTKFQVTRVGCGLAGLKDEDIAPMFEGAPPNCWFDDEWQKYLGDNYNYWGTV